jgi:hypothetical protein
MAKGDELFGRLSRIHTHSSLLPMAPAVQIISVYWRWDDNSPAKAEEIRQFKKLFRLSGITANVWVDDFEAGTERLRT